MSNTMRAATKVPPRAGVSRDRAKTIASQVLRVVVLAVASVLALFPVYFMFVTAFKGQQEYLTNKVGVPLHPVISNFTRAFEGRDIPLWFMNSAILTASAVAVSLLFSSLAAFAFARMRFRGKDVIFNGMVSLMVIPPVVMIIPIFVLLVNIHLVNNYIGAILVYVGLLLPFSVYLLTSFFQTVSQEIVDAAIIDGCTDFTVYRKIMLPLAGPALATLLVVNSLWVWNELLVALILLQKNELKTLMVGLTVFASKFQIDVPVTMAGLVIATIPLIVLYLLGQRMFIRGLVSGSVKE